VLLSTLLLSSFVAASPSPWAGYFPDLDTIVVRQNNNDNSNGSQPPPTSSTQSSKAAPTTSSTSGTGTKTTSSGTKSTGKATGKATASTKPSNTTSEAPHHTLFDPEDPAGGISLVTPAVTLGEQFYKIGDFVTFVFDMTSVQATPTALDIMATCSANSQLYPIAMNQTVHNATGSVTWDTSAYQETAASAPLLTEIYTLIIYDADSSISATAEAGYLAVYDQYTFGMYSPQPYTPLSDFECATCSGALGDMEKRALGMVFAMGAITVLSFTWFVTGLNVVW